MVIQGDERKLNSLLSTVEGPVGEVKIWLIQQLPGFLCGASSEAGYKPVNEDSQRRYGQNKCEKEMNWRIPVPNKSYKESPKEDQRRT